MEWYVWVIIGWLLHWFWGIWHRIEPRLEQEGILSKEATERIERKRRAKNILDLALARGEINEAEYKGLVGDYQVEVGTENQSIEETEQMQNLGDAIDGLCRLGYKKHKVKEILQSINTSGMTVQEIMKAVMAKI